MRTRDFTNPLTLAAYDFSERRCLAVYSDMERIFLHLEDAFQAGAKWAIEKGAAAIGEGDCYECPGATYYSDLVTALDLSQSTGEEK